MNFHVKPNDLDSFGDQLKNLAKQTDTANDYLAKNASITSKEAGIGGKFIWGEAITKLEEAVGAINKNLNKLKSLSSSSGDEVHDSASMYRGTDEQEARRLDNTY